MSKKEKIIRRLNSGLLLVVLLSVLFRCIKVIIDQQQFEHDYLPKYIVFTYQSLGINFAAILLSGFLVSLGLRMKKLYLFSSFMILLSIVLGYLFMEKLSFHLTLFKFLYG